MKKVYHFSLSGAIFDSSYHAAARKGPAAIDALREKASAFIEKAFPEKKFEVSSIGYDDVTFEIELTDESEAYIIAGRIAANTTVREKTPAQEKADFGLISVSVTTFDAEGNDVNHDLVLTIN